MTKAQEIIEKARKKTETLRQMEKMFFRTNKNIVDSNGRLKFGIDIKKAEKEWKELKKFWRTGGN